MLRIFVVAIIAAVLLSLPAFGQNEDVLKEQGREVMQEQSQGVMHEQGQEVIEEAGNAALKADSEMAEEGQGETVQFKAAAGVAGEEATERILVIEEAKERTKCAVAVEVYLIDDILEVTAIAKMYTAKPLIHKVLVVGSKLGRLSPQERQTLYPKAEDQEAFYKTKDIEGGIIRLKKREKKKKLKEGALTKELIRFKIPTDKIVKKKRYQLWVKIESLQRGGQFESFKFELKDFPELVHR
ncbi:hypothetical protein ACFL1D_05510 [Candidatus Omnitrophota bacterium]